MYEYISDYIAARLVNLSYISKAAGCVVDIPYKDTGLIIPASRSAYPHDPDKKSEEYTGLMPSGEEIGIAYLGDNGAQLKDSNTMYNTWSGSMDLTIWLNYNYIGEHNGKGIVLEHLISHVPEQIPNHGNITGITLEVVQRYPKRPSPFKQYGYDELKSQFLIHPYEYHWLRILYTARASKVCTTPIIVQHEEC